MLGSPWRLGTTLVLAVTTIICVASAAVAISRTPDAVSSWRSIETRLDTQSESASVTIYQGDSAAVIARRLLTSEALDSQTRFELLASLLGWEGRLEPGSYSFEPGLTTYEILRRIHFGVTSPLRVVIPEGLRVEQIMERLHQANVIDRAEFAVVLQTAATDTLAGQRPSGASLEGYLFPSAYSFPLGTTAEEALQLMLQRFDQSLSPQLLERISASGRTLHEILAIASIIEREVIEDSERVLVSAVIWNRLAAAMPLQMDSTVQYAVGDELDWWKRELTREDLAVESPYNTYVVSGLPPTPIASPGLSSIEAAVNPASVPYIYFVARGDGTHAFAVTYEEHQANVERYRGGGE